MEQDSYDFLKDDPNIGYLVKACPLPPIPQINMSIDLYLIKSIVSQQLSSKAAATIYSRFKTLFYEDTPSIEELLKIEIEALRNVGLSYRKAAYVKEVAQYFKNHDKLDFTNKNDDDLIDALSSIKGVGEWTVQMLLIFKLKRPDILPLGDLVVRKGLMSLLKIPTNDKKTNEKIITHAERWQPYRSYVSRLMWAAKGEGLLDI